MTKIIFDTQRKTGFKNRFPTFLFFLVVFLFSSFSFAIDSPPFPSSQVSQPESISVNGNLNINLFSGAAAFSLPLEVPSGTRGLQPDLSLSYNSHSARGRPGVLGSGWSLSQSYIQRNANNTFSSTTDDYFELYFGGGPQKLVYSPEDGRYHTQIESFLWIKKETGSNNDKGEYWTIKTKDGTAYRFGFNKDSETVANKYNYVWRWNLDLVRDTFGNSIFYSYKENPFPDDLGAVYLDEISYNQKKYNLVPFGFSMQSVSQAPKKVSFVYENEDRPDMWKAYDNGNLLSESRRLKEISITVNSNLVRKYSFSFGKFKFINGVTYLESITETGSDGTSKLPATRFSYHDVKDGWHERSDLALLNCGGETNTGRCFINFNQWNSGTARLIDNAVRLVDLNGDGFQDIVRAGAAGLINSSNGPQWYARTWISNGTNWNENSTWNPPTCGPSDELAGCFVDPSPTFADRGVRFVDLNNDGLVDILYGGPSHANNYGQTIANINTGSGWTLDTSWFMPKCHYNSTIQYTYGEGCFTDSAGRDFGVRLADVNGDGLLDIVRAAVTTAFAKGKGTFPESPPAIYLNNGSGWKISNEWKFPGCKNETSAEACFVIFDWIDGKGGNQMDNGVRIVDINGDGLADLVRGSSNYAGSYSKIWINNGTGWEVDSRWALPACTDQLNRETCFTYGFSDNGIQLTDINGDGLVDLVRAAGNVPCIFIQGFGNSCPEWQPRIWLNNGTGWVVASFMVGMDWKGWFMPNCSVSSIYDVSRESYLLNKDGYDNGVRLTDVNGDGYDDLVRSTPGEAPNSKTWLSNGSQHYLLKDIITPFGGKISLEYKPSTAQKKGEASNLSMVLWLVANKTEDNGLSGANRVVSTFSYDYFGGKFDFKEKEFRGFGKVVEKLSDGSVRTHFFHQDKARNGIEYISEHVSSIIGNLGYPHRTEHQTWEFAEKSGIFVNQLKNKKVIIISIWGGGKESTEEDYGYDDFNNLVEIHQIGNTFLQGDERYQVAKYAYNTDAWIVDKPINTSLLDFQGNFVSGNLLFYDTQGYGQPPTQGVVTEQHSVLLGAQANPATRMGYDLFGNVNSLTDPDGHPTSFFYDGTHTFITKETNARGHETIFDYDLGTGNVLSTTDPNNFQTTYVYDPLGRKIKEIREYDDDSLPTISYSYTINGSSPAWIKVIGRKDHGDVNTIDSFSFYDGFGRLVQQKRESEGNHFITNDYYYDSLGKIQRVSNPYLSGSGYSAGNISQYYTNFSFDALGRLIETRFPDNTTKLTYPAAFALWVFNQDNPFPWRDNEYNKGRTNIYFDAYQNIIKVVEHKDNIGFGTWYRYDAQGNLINITDAQDNQMIYTYDSLGRKTTMVDPDMGTWQYQYDAKGNLVTQTDNEGNTVSFLYDELGRPLKKIAEEGNTTYLYDTPTKGTLSGIKGPGFEKTFSYDRRKRVVKETISIDGQVFSTQFSYNSQDAVNETQLPSGTRISVKYNGQGLPQAVGDVITDAAYGSSYSPDLKRPVRVETPALQRMSYGYDKVGNVVALNDSIEKKEQEFSYDEWGRLIRASSPGFYNVSYQYDGIGNMLREGYDEKNISYVYGGRAHAPSGISIVDSGLVSFKLSLRKGWNIISLPLVINATIKDVLREAGLNASLSFHSQNKSFYEPEFFEPSQGYLVLVNASGVIGLKGKKITDPAENLSTGVHLWGLPSLQERGISSVFPNISVMAFNGSWSSFDSSRNNSRNTLSAFIPGQGYWVTKKG